MTRITTPFALVIYLISSGLTVWAQEPSQPTDTTQTEGAAHPNQTPPEKNLQETPKEMGTEQGPTQPAGPAQPPGTQPAPEETPQIKPEEKAPGQAPTQPAGPAQPPGTQPAPEGTPQAKPEEKTPGQAPTQPAGPTQPPGTQPAPEGTPQAKPPGTTVEKTLQATEEEKKETATTQIEQAIDLFLRGRLQLSMSLGYSASSSNQLFIEGFGILPILVIGETQVQRIRRDTFVTSLGISYRLMQDLSASLNIPYKLIFSRVSTAAGVTGRSAVNTNVDQFSRSKGLGDVSGGLSYHLLTERLAVPNLYAGMGFSGRTGRDSFTRNPTRQSPTGSGFNSISVSLNATKTADPAVVYGSVSFGHPLPRHHLLYFPPNAPPRLIDFTPGDSVSFSMGTSYALNYKLNLSLGYSQAIGFPAHIKGVRQSNTVSNAASVLYGVGWRINQHTSIALSLSQGLTLDSGDFSISLRIPYSF